MKKPIYETEMLTDPYQGIYTKKIYYDDGSMEELKIPKGKIISFPIQPRKIKSWNLNEYLAENFEE